MDAKPNGCTDTGNYKLPTVTVVAMRAALWATSLHPISDKSRSSKKTCTSRQLAKLVPNGRLDETQWTTTPSTLGHSLWVKVVGVGLWPKVVGHSLGLKVVRCGLWPKVACRSCPCMCVCAGVRACCRCDAQTQTQPQMMRHSTHICY